MSLNKPLVTVLMPVFNAESFLKEAIQSILEQTYDCFELLIINDGSTDKSVDIITEFNDRRIRLVSLEKNNGIISALNLGLKLAQGDYLARMDADDISLPERLAKQVDFLEKNRDVGCLGTDFVWLDEPNQKSWIQYFDSENIRVALLFECGLCHPTVMLRMSDIHLHNFVYPKDFPHAEDYALWVSISQKVKLANLREPLLKYRRHNKQISQTKNEVQCLSIDKIQILQLRSLKIQPTYSDLMLHHLLGSAFIPIPNFRYLLSRWKQLLISRNLECSFFPNEVMSKQLENRLRDTMVNIDFHLSKKTLESRLLWQINSGWRYLTNYNNKAQ